MNEYGKFANDKAENANNEPKNESLQGNTQTPEKSKLDELKAKYGGKVYKIGATIEVDDESEKTVEYFFKRPSTGSYDRYVKTTAQGATKSLKTLLFDNVTEESRAALEADLEEFPALALSIGEKLLGLLGLSKQTNLKLL